MMREEQFKKQFDHQAKILTGQVLELGCVAATLTPLIKQIFPVRSNTRFHRNAWFRKPKCLYANPQDGAKPDRTYRI